MATIVQIPMKFVWEYLNFEHGWQGLRLDHKAIKRGRNKALTYISKHKDRVADGKEKNDEYTKKRKEEGRGQMAVKVRRKGRRSLLTTILWLSLCSRIRGRKLKAEPES